MQANKIISMALPDSMVTEAYRLLSINVQHAFPDKQMKVVLVTSASPGEGKTTIAANLAATYAQQNKQVLLIDANLRKPMLHQMFLSGNAIGLTNILNKMVHLDEDLPQTGLANLYLIPSGPIPANPSGLFSTGTFDQLLEEMRRKFDVILIDAPAVLSLADVPVLAAKCDGVLLVVHSKKGKRRYVRQAMSKLRYIQANVIGAVMNDTKHHDENRNFYYYNSKN